MPSFNESIFLLLQCWQKPTTPNSRCLPNVDNPSLVKIEHVSTGTFWQQTSINKVGINWQGNYTDSRETLQRTVFICFELHKPPMCLQQELLKCSPHKALSVEVCLWKLLGGLWDFGNTVVTRLLQRRPTAFLADLKTSPKTRSKWHGKRVLSSGHPFSFLCNTARGEHAFMHHLLSAPRKVTGTQDGQGPTG